MTQAFESGDVTFLEFSSGDSAATRVAKVATFAAPTGRGSARSPESENRCTLIGKSPEMQDIRAHLCRIAPSVAPVMLVGESGTGKEVAAQLLHEHSNRSNAPFVSVNCGAIPANLVEAELFGYERGAFTGAVRQHQGYFERAAGGTLFLDEITEMPIELQGKLLRVLETGRMIRIGGVEEIGVDVRIVTATNRPSETIVRDRRMREDLFYRLAVFIVRLPPLRSRRDDIELLARAFLARLNKEYGTAKWFDAATLEVARNHAWPGNVRELKNCVERSFVLCDDVVALDLQPAPESELGDEYSADCLRLPIGVTMADAERELLLATLKHCGGNKKRTADVLGVSLKTVYNKLVGYGVATPLLRAAGQS